MKIRLVILCLFFARIFGMEVNENDVTTMDASEELVSENNGSFRPQSLTHLVAQFLAKKLIIDCLCSDNYEEYLASHPLTEEAQALIIKNMPSSSPVCLWKALPYDVICQNINIKCKVVIPLKDDQLLIHYYDDAENPDLAGYLVSKIKIWDMKTQNWIKTVKLPALYVQDLLLSPDLKTLFLISRYRGIVIIYDLLEDKLDGSLQVRNPINFDDIIKSFTCSDKYLFLGLYTGKVLIYKIITRGICGFQYGEEPIYSIDILDDIIAITNPNHIECIKLTDDGSNIKGNIIGSLNIAHDENRIWECKLGLSGKTLVTRMHEFLKIYKLPNIKLLKAYTIKPGLGVKKLHQDHIFVVSELSRTWNGQFYINALLFLDGKTGKAISKLNLDDHELLHTGHYWDNFSISHDNRDIILSNEKGLIAKISLNLDGNLHEVLRKIKLNYGKKLSTSDRKSESRCLIS